MMEMGFPLGPRKGSDLRQIYQALLPFNQQGELLPEDKRLALLASNSNYPNELQTNAFVQASALGKGSPQIVQYSYNSTTMEGADAQKLKVPGGRYTELRPAGVGSWMSHHILSKHASLWNADMMFMALDHFTAPGIKDVVLSTVRGGIEYELAKTRIEHAVRSLRTTVELNLKEKEYEEYIGYVLSGEYQSYRKDFLAAVQYGNPTWAMIDTGGLPLVLNFATSRDILGAVRNELNNKEVMLEAELSATGQSGQEEHYTYWKEMNDGERDIEKQLVTSFIRYTGADAIAYEIGMEHAAKSGESHEPDEDKLREIQFALYRTTGRHIPFAQHGGTGSSRIIKGLVGKYNVNTQYLQAGALAELERCEKMGEQIRSRQKKAIGTDRFVEEIARVRESCLEYLVKTGTKDMSPLLRTYLSRSERMGVYAGAGIEGAE